LNNGTAQSGNAYDRVVFSSSVAHENPHVSAGQRPVAVHPSVPEIPPDGSQFQAGQFALLASVYDLNVWRDHLPERFASIGATWQFSDALEAFGKFLPISHNGENGRPPVLPRPAPLHVSDEPPRGGFAQLLVPIHEVSDTRSLLLDFGISSIACGVHALYLAIVHDTEAPALRAQVAKNRKSSSKCLPGVVARIGGDMNGTASLLNEFEGIVVRQDD
jgi:hypothetical protein